MARLGLVVFFIGCSSAAKPQAPASRTPHDAPRTVERSPAERERVAATLLPSDIRTLCQELDAHADRVLGASLRARSACVARGVTAAAAQLTAPDVQDICQAALDACLQDAAPPPNDCVGSLQQSLAHCPTMTVGEVIDCTVDSVAGAKALATMDVCKRLEPGANAQASLAALGREATGARCEQLRHRCAATATAPR